MQVGLGSGKILIGALAAFVAISFGSAQDADAKEKCFSNGARQPNGGAGDSTYMLGIGADLVAISLTFFPDGRVCGYGEYIPLIRIEGRNISDGKIEVNFLPDPKQNPPQKKGNKKDDDIEVEAYPDLGKVVSSRATGTAIKSVVRNVVIWEGTLAIANGESVSFYLKRTRTEAHAPPEVTNGAECAGDGGCAPLTVLTEIKRGSSLTFRNDVKSLPVTKIDRDCGEEPSKGRECFTVHTWPFEEDNVIKALRRRPYVLSARRDHNGAGVDLDTVQLDSDELISVGKRLNIQSAIDIFGNAIVQYFQGTGVSVSDPIYRQNSLIWQLKGRRFQFEKTNNPSPAEKSEWWKVRLQIAVTADQGHFLLIIGLPETRTVSWSMESVPNDEKFTTEETNDERFTDLQGKLIVALTKTVAITKEMP